MAITDEHYTPKWLFDSMDIRFDLDVASPKGGSHVPADRYYTQEDNGLVQPWSGRVWMNPPYSLTTPWVHKFIDNGHGVALLVVSRSKWFQALWDVSDAIVPTPHDLKFDRPDGTSTRISFQTFLFAMGDDCVKAINRVADRRVR
jgi:phage N-6-adenine-methyltransferase